jgi:hypothetical protein
MMRLRSNLYRQIPTALAALALVGALPQLSHSATLLDDSFEDGLFLDGSDTTNLPDETLFYVGRPDDALEGIPGVARYAMEPGGSQKGHFYFTNPGKYVQLDDGDTLTVSISFFPRGAINLDDTSRNFRWGVFHDPTDPQVLANTNDDGGGTGDPWTDAQGYGVQMAFMSDPTNTRTPFDAGKRTDLGNSSLLGSSGAYTKTSGGDPIVYALNNEYTFVQEITRVSSALTTYTTSIFDKTAGGTLLSSLTVNDNGSDLGTDPAYNRFSFVGFRNSTAEESAAVFDFTNFTVTGPGEIPEPTTLLLGSVLASLTLIGRRRK